MRRRDRHERGPRGPLAWPRVPAMRSRREAFDELVLDSADRLEKVLADHRVEVEFAVEDVPPSDPAPWEEQVAPLGRYFPAQGRLAHRIVVYRRPIEAQARDEMDLALIVHEVVLEQVAALLGVPPGELDDGD
ncbi:metallopeptidase family protein [Nostocoides japonicum]|uniref:metallopeptidase family protein n=1 Tax=Nostocoides japonicum TaxID=99481 RepID=UPI001F1D4359|nr:metallopeptidase family protein [Tetrasphaera japonica]